ncbi:hypothetical protein AMTR_s00002p00262040 [Amborella trichopoda]|uniref:Uncharacterized protein n=1 Tax=Amborella trichopoda TaxID=13333 RepID=W1P348_AMBTC|nr:hypothetical protein AMTR_s00002p00262040 [Amborella trichopoda]
MAVRTRDAVMVSMGQSSHGDDPPMADLSIKKPPDPMFSLSKLGGVSSEFINGDVAKVLQSGFPTKRDLGSPSFGNDIYVNGADVDTAEVNTADVNDVIVNVYGGSVEKNVFQGNGVLDIQGSDPVDVNAPFKDAAVHEDGVLGVLEKSTR